jgi:tripeptide aminopeptidase
MDKVKNRIDYTFLMEVLAVQTSVLDDTKMSAYIKTKLAELDVEVQEDNYGNIYVTKGTSSMYPCLIAHTDTVHPIISKFHLFRDEDILFAFNPSTGKQTGIGGDDKVGVFILLQALVDIPSMKAVFYRHEETGCHGSSYSIKNHKDWYADCGYIIEPDRRGSTDAITNSGGIKITSPGFINDIMPFMEKYGYSEAIGIFTDVDTLVTHEVGISAINLSCGYHNPHGSSEIVSISEVNIAYNLIFDMVIANPNKQYPHAVVIEPYKSSFSYFGKKGNKWTETIERTAPSSFSSPLQARQGKFFPPLVFEHYGNKTTFNDFIEYDVLKDNKKVYRFTGIKALSLIGDLHCPHCKKEVLETVFYLPYEGRMYCANCHDYIDDTKVQFLLKALEVEDTDVTFVYSVYSNGWLDKDNAVWSDKVQSWISDDLPF